MKTTRRFYMGMLIEGYRGHWEVEGVIYSTLEAAKRDIRSWWETNEE